MILRDYQAELSLRTRRALSKYRKVCMTSPTGSGKTVIAADMFVKATKKGIKPVFLTDRIEIATKTKETLEEWGLTVQLISASTGVVYKADCYVAMAETFYRRCVQGRFPKHVVKLLFCDECHMSVFNKTIELFPNAYICGLTATPISSSFNLNKVYQKIVVGESTPSLINKGYLCKSIDIGQRQWLDLKMEKGEYSILSQREAFTSNNLNTKCIELWLKHAKNRSTICYNIDIEHNQQMEAEFKKIGVSVGIVDGKTPDAERSDIFTRYNNGEIQVLLNVGIATKGFDSPITSCIIANFTTASLSKWFQVTGRGARLREGKNDFITIDIGNNIPRHGSYNDEIDWEYLFNNPEEDIKNKKPKPKKLCNVCLAYIHNIHELSCYVCDTKIVLKDLISIESQMPEHLINKSIKEMSRDELQIYQKFKGYKNGWAHFQHQINMRTKYKQGRLF
jgi:superfamily II DNA or RNA helicase